MDRGRSCAGSSCSRWFAAGFPSTSRFATATAIRDRIAPRGKVRLEDISSLVDELLDDRYDLDALGAVTAIEPPRVVEEDGSWSPFSKGILAVSLMGAGLEPEDAHDVAREIERSLLRQGRAAIDRTELRHLVAATIERTDGPGPARWYRVWRSARDDGKPSLVLWAAPRAPARRRSRSRSRAGSSCRA